MDDRESDSANLSTPEQVFGKRNAHDIALSNRIYRLAFVIYLAIMLGAFLVIIRVLPGRWATEALIVLVPGLAVAMVGFLSLTIRPVLRLSRLYEGGSRLYFLINAPTRSDRFQSWCDEHGYRRIDSNST